VALGNWFLYLLESHVVGCCWLYIVKVGPYGKIDRFKVRLVTKRYTQIFGLDYSDTLSYFVKMAFFFRLFFSIVAIPHWPLHQLDIKNAFMHGDLEEEIYIYIYEATTWVCCSGGVIYHGLLAA